MARAAAACNDAQFGPVSSCRDFDFSLTFQHDILIIASTIFVAAALVQIGRVAPKPVLGSGASSSSTWGLHGQNWRQCDVIGSVRALLALVYFSCTAATLAAVADNDDLQHALVARTALPALVVAFLASFLLIPLTILCRRKLPHSSMVSGLYLFVTVLTDACRVRTYSAVPDLRHSSLFALSCAGLLFKGLLFAAESTPGQRVPGTTRESRASFLSRMVFWWLMDILWTGFRRPLDMMNLDALASRYDARTVGAHLQGTWDRQVHRALAKQGSRSIVTSPIDNDAASSHNGEERYELDELRRSPSLSSRFSMRMPPMSPEKQAAQLADSSRTLLPKAIVLSFPSIVLAPIIPRLIWTGVSLSMPYLVNRTLAFAESQASPTEAQPSEFGWGLVGAYALTGIITAFSSGQFYWAADKGQVLLRGALVDNIYRKSLRLHLTDAGEVGAGAVANLMSVDLERVCRAILPFHLLWNGVLQVGLSSYLLYRTLGLTFFASLVSISFCMLAPPVLARGIGARQTAWSKATDQRVNLTSSAIANAKAVKYMAYEGFVEERLLECRKEEQKVGWEYYKQLLYVSALTNLTMEFTALATFTTLFIVDHVTGSERFNIQTIITSMTLLALMETPLLQMGQQYSSILAALASLRRIQNFLAKNERVRHTIPSNSGGDREVYASSLRSRQASTRSTLSQRKVFGNGTHLADERFTVASFRTATIGWTQGKPVLINITLDIPKDKLTIICGPIGSGKSTLLQAVLGEVDVFSGYADLPITKGLVAYAAQDGWLQDELGIRDNITLQSAFDGDLYQTVLRATAFDIDVTQLPKKDDTKAKELSGGQRQRVALARAIYSQADAYVLDDFTSALDAETAAHVWNTLFGPSGLLCKKTVIFATNALHLLHHADYVVRLEAGKVVEAGTYHDMNLDIAASSSGAANGQTEHSQSDAKSAKDKQQVTIGDEDGGKDEEVEKGTVKWSVYGQWCRAIGILFFVFIMLCGPMLEVAAKIGWQVYLQYFARAQGTVQGRQNEDAWLGGFIALCICPMILLPLVLFATFWATMKRAGIKLHAKEIHGVLSSGIVFFESHPPGVIINRFSQDLFVLDWELALAFANFTACIMMVFAQVTLLVVPVPLLMIVVVIVAALYCLIQRLYAPVSRQLRRLEMATKSPLYSQIAETSKPAGLVTIRALRRQQLFIDTNTGRLNRSQQPYYMLQAVRRWLLTALGILAAIVNVALVAIVVIMRRSSNVSVLGAGLVSATQMSLELTQAVVALTELEIASVALERIVAFSQLPPEEAGASHGVLRKQLLREEVAGALEFENVTIAYKEGLKPALQDVTLSIRAGERIGICGRSGSGKSTLLLALFRMLEPCRGRILLDGEPISKQTVQSLRDSLTIVPQTALVLAATVRQNLDPMKENDDVAIWEALDTCRLLDVVRAFPHGLDSELDSTLSLSAGQRQLFSLARAILRRRKVLILDEATSSMDYETDAAVQQVLVRATRRSNIA